MESYILKNLIPYSMERNNIYVNSAAAIKKPKRLGFRVCFYFFLVFFKYLAIPVARTPRHDTYCWKTSA